MFYNNQNECLQVLQIRQHFNPESGFIPEEQRSRLQQSALSIRSAEKFFWLCV